MDSRDDGVTMIAYMLQAAEFSKDVIRILSDDTEVFVMLLYWIWKMQLHCSVQLERWNGVVVDINATSTELGPKCLQLMGMHVLSGCETVSYPFNKGKISALNTLQAGDFPGLYQVLGEEGTTHSNLMETGQRFFAALCGQPLGTTRSEAITGFTQGRRESQCATWHYLLQKRTYISMLAEHIFK